MSIFNELLPQIIEISNAYSKNFNDELEAIFECFDKFEEEFLNDKRRAREKTLRDKNLTSLQSINEDEDEPLSKPARKSTTHSPSGSNRELDSRKRNKDEVDGISSPEQDKRRKRNASVKAQSIISKQKNRSKNPLTAQNNSSIIIITPLEEVNVNLTQKMRRDDSVEKSLRTRKRNDNKENAEPIIHIKQEKVSIVPEPMDLDSIPLNIEVKQEPNKDEISMPPPTMPVPKPRKTVKDVKSVSEISEEDTARRSSRNTRTKKTDTMPPPPVPSSRSTRSSSRASTRKQTDAEDVVQPEPRPKRTRAKKKVSDTPTPDLSQVSKHDDIIDNTTVSESAPAEKARPKRTRRGQKAAKQEPQADPQPVFLSAKEERISQPDISSPILPKSKPKTKTADTTTKEGKAENSVSVEVSGQSNKVLDETNVLCVTGCDMDKTVVLPSGVYNHVPVTPSVMHKMNETVVLDKCNRDTIVLDKHNAIMDATVVIEKDLKPSDNITEDNSILTEDNSEIKTPPKTSPPQLATSAVKEKVQQFEEMATRVTRTKTRAMAKKEDDPADTQTPPDKITKPVLSAETLHKMNTMIFNGKQISSSATKPRANITTSVKSFLPMSASKVTVTKKEIEDNAKREKEDARKKKEALLEAKREAQKRKREEKMLAAAMVREAAEKERLAAIQAAAREKMEKIEKADQGKIERMREQERKKQELARKVAETEERRRLEEQARQHKLCEEQRRALALKKKQFAEQEATKKEALMMQKEIEKRQKEYLEKQKLKQRLESERIHTPLKCATNYPPLEPAYMCDGFQHLNSDSDSEPADIPPPLWSTSRMRKQQLCIQYQVSPSHVDRLFSVRVHSPDLREIFPLIERARLKRTSSAVWRTPPHRLPAVNEW